VVTLPRLKPGLGFLLIFVLIGLGGLCLIVSPWPRILRSMIHGAHVRVFPHWETVGLPLLTLLLWAGAIAVSLRVERPTDS
jgi:hypothetical protein